MSRRRDRRLAVEVLYAADVRDARPQAILTERSSDEADVHDYAEHLVAEVERRRDEIDALLVKQAPGWPPERMSVVDRNVLRVALLELLEGENPDAVVIDEAVELAKTFSGQDAARFVNGVLSGVARARRGEAEE